MPGGRIDILVHPDTREFVGKLRSGLAPAVGVAGAIGGALGLAIGGAAAFGQVIKIGNEFTTSLNTMKAVAGATADQMAQVSAKARQLGQDVSLPGTSANDAASAMLELAKGGFSVQQAMDAARGSLQLAAAAQVDAAEAARIQSSALQAFGLQAADAGRVADVLANTANASSAEITDVAYALQSGATVAHQFGLTIEDTAAAIGLFANSGIKGSDAGTLLKTALLALTDQGKPAQAAIRELGLRVYDAQGRFVGLHKLFGQLADASHRMTDEQYQAATATLFGSDAMRLASIAAEKGAAGFDAMHAAMSKQGSAAAVAAARMQGLPGAMQQAKNAAEGLALGIYDLVKGPLEAFTKKTADVITDATPGIVGGLHAGADAAVALGREIAPLAKWLADLPPPILAATAALIAFRATGIGTALSSAVGTSTGALRGFNEQMAVQRSLAAASGHSIGAFGAAVATLETKVPVLSRMGEAYRATAESASVFARTQGTVAAATTGLRSAAGGLVGLLGGPWGLAIAGATALVAAHIEASSKARAMQSTLAEATVAGAKAQAEFGKAVGAANGALNQQSLAAANAAVKASLAEIVEGAAQGQSAIGRLQKQLQEWRVLADRPMKDPIGLGLGEDTDVYTKRQRQIDAYNALRNVLGQLKIDMNDLGAVVAKGGPQYDSLISKLRASGDAGAYAADKLQATHEQLAQAQRTAANTTRGYYDLAAAVKILADQSASAADRVNAMKTALDVLSGKPVQAQEALAQYNEQVRNTAAATQQAWDRTKGWGDALIGQSGQVNTATENGKRLYDQLQGIIDKTVGVAAAGGDVAPVLARNGQLFEQLAAQAGLSRDQVERMAAQLGYLPKNIEILAQLKGADGVEQQLIVIQGLLQANAAGVDIPVNADTEAAIAKLKEAGVKVEEVNGKKGVVHVSADDAEARRKLDELIAKQLPVKKQKVVVEYETRGEALARAGVPQDFVGPVQVQPRAEGGVSGPLPSQATIQAPQPRLYQWAEPETGGEAFIPLAPSKRSRSVDILATVAGHFGFGLTQMAEGGIAVTRAMNFLRGQSGKAYQYGGVGNPSWDCSGFISAAYALLKGLSPFTRWFTTESNFGALGFRRGLDPTGRGLSIGVYNGGGGQYSHMAGTLAGTPLESGSNGVRVGTGAAGAADGQFPNKYHLPGSAFNPPDSGAGSGRVTLTVRGSGTGQTGTWDASDDLELESARISLNKAKQRRDEDLADPKKSPDDKRQAEIDVQRAELRVKELEEKKDRAATTGGPVPEAPPLAGNLTDDEIRLQELHLAIKRAKDERNEVYNDPEASEDDRLAADLALQRAMNALAEEQKKQREDENAVSGGSGSSSSPVELLGDAVKEAVVGQVRDVLTVIGLGGDIQGVTGAAIGIAADQFKKQQRKPAPGPFSPDELAKQGPVTPGTPNWLEEMMKTLRIPAVIRDEGGPLPTGTAAINTSGETEWVFTGAQMRAAAAGRAAMKQTIDASVRIENLHTGMSAGEFQREWKMLQIGQRDRARAWVGR
ncbi:phage tail tape measure protein [Nocardia sp. CDC159]|uniref:Phage tail tape measure protein n=1 Tax=Nocardia pulmonis TaxID=2951408 RepID=A0A9X2IZF7_9NOCA|nr:MULTISPECIES: phage tail tape measure protein [Nocardia]MCM6778027.1 phage tail tape measure protein [Nocardia pulmonis]MCM6790802.1 phage tail tape measure protein [Nocardia sp. CDC159]